MHLRSSDLRRSNLARLEPPNRRRKQDRSRAALRSTTGVSSILLLLPAHPTHTPHSLIIFTGLRLGSFTHTGFPSNFTLREAPYICWTQAELSYSIIAATIPTARRLMLDFITYYNGGNFGTSGTRTGVSRGAAGGNSHSQGEGIQMRSFRSTGRRKSDMGYAGGTLRERGGERERDGEGVAGDGDSQEMIIRKDVTYQVDKDTVNGRQEHAGMPKFI